MDFGSGRGEYNILIGNYADNYDIGTSMYDKVGTTVKNNLFIASGGKKLPIL